MALYAKVNEFGFLEAPYRKVVQEKNGKSVVTKATNEIVYLTADDEQKHYVTHNASLIGDKILEERVPARYKGEFMETEKEKY